MLFRSKASEQFTVPSLDIFKAVLEPTTAGREISTTQAYVRFLTQLLRDRLALALALLVGLLDIIPLVGATIGSTVAVLVALTHSLTAGIVMLVLAISYQFLENHVIQPLVMRKSVDVSPFIVLVSVLVGASLLGIVGALLAIPVAGSVQVILRQVLQARKSRVAAEREQLGAVP